FNDANKTDDDYSYDDFGNLITDKNKNITEIAYNHLNLPKKITFGTTGSIDYIYSAAGQKLEKIVTEGTVTTTTSYLAGYQYKDNVLEFFPTEEGYVKNTAGVLSYVYQYKDHLGNVRVSYAKNPTTQVLEIIEENNYYPFGLKHKGYNDYLASVNKYKYNGQEFQDELQLNMTAMDYRQYDSALGRFNSIDVLAELFPEESPFNFSLNNPIYFNDPTGLCPSCPSGAKNGQVYNSTGGGTYIYNNGQWTRQDGELKEVVVTSSAPKKKKEAKKSEGQAGKPVAAQEKTALFGLIRNPNVNSKGQSPLEEYREYRDYPLYHEGESWLDHWARGINSSHMDIMLDYGSGGYNMYGGYGRAVTASTGAFSVYQGVDSAGIVRYVGITSRNPLIRFAEHLSSMGKRASLRYSVIEGATNLTKEQAKVLEQTLINQYKMQKNGGQLVNLRNSIAPSKWSAKGVK
uniref:RHS repeat domain-containing protein n=1 Tax=Flavobacterium olei TaxID=1886782 RepID=UPI00321B59BA